MHTDDYTASKNLPDCAHEPVKHSVEEYVRGKAHTQGIESRVVHAQAKPQGRLAPHELAAPEPLRERVHRPLQPARA